MTAVPTPVASPCIGVCRIDRAARICVGCGRTGNEIGRWREGSDAERAAVLAAIPARLAGLDTTASPANLSATELSADVVAALEAGGGTFVVGGHGAVAEFMVPDGSTARVSLGNDDVLTAEIPGGRLRLDLRRDLAAFRTGGSDGTLSGPMLLAVPASTGSLPVAFGLTRIGPDPAPIGPCEAGADCAVLFDLGLGSAAFRFMVRTADPALVRCLDGLEGAPLALTLARAGAALTAASPARVVETAAARVEVDTTVPAPAGRSPAGPHTHLVAGAAALGRLLPPGIGCPTGMIPVALHYP